MLARQQVRLRDGNSAHCIFDAGRFYDGQDTPDREAVVVVVAAQHRLQAGFLDEVVPANAGTRQVGEGIYWPFCCFATPDHLCPGHSAQRLTLTLSPENSGRPRHELLECMNELNSRSHAKQEGGLGKMKIIRTKL